MFHADKRMWVLVLNKYQRDNLLTLLNAIGYGPPETGGAVEPFTLYNTGDWVGEIALGLGEFDKEPPPLYGEEPGRSPNKSIEALRADVQRWLHSKEKP